MRPSGTTGTSAYGSAGTRLGSGSVGAAVVVARTVVEVVVGACVTGADVVAVASTFGVVDANALDPDDPACPVPGDDSAGSDDAGSERAGAVVDASVLHIAAVAAATRTTGSTARCRCIPKASAA
jgi:hypothetical protein